MNRQQAGSRKAARFCAGALRANATTTASSAALLALGLVLSACGGGGGGDSSSGPSAPAIAAPAESTAIRDFSAPAGFAFANYQIPRTLLPADFTGVEELAARASPTFVKVWIEDGAGEQSVLFLGRWSSLASGVPVQVPAAVREVRFEAYNAAGSLAGKVSL